MKVLHIISSSGMYGAEAVILNLARAMAARPNSCALAVFENASNPNRQLYDTATHAGIETHLIPCSSQFDRTTLPALRSVAAKSQADVIHAHGYKADVYTFFALRGTVPLVSTCHTWYDNDRLVTLYGKLDRLVLRGFTSVVAVSEQVRQRLLSSGVRADHIDLVRNGIDLRPFAAAPPSLGNHLPPGGLLVGLIGRLAWEKGVDIYLDAVARVHKELPDTRYCVVGDGPDGDRLQGKIDSLDLRDTVVFLGRRDDMPAVYASLDLMVSASRQEGLPIALLEGMASGLPVVATAVGEVPSVVREGVTGLVVPPGDPAALAAAMLQLLRDPERRAMFSDAARKTIASEYSADRMAADYRNVYEQAIAAHRPKRSKMRASLAPGRGSVSSNGVAGGGESIPPTKARASGGAADGGSTGQPQPRVFMMDLCATVPYYTAYLSRALVGVGANVAVGSITYYLDPKCHSARGLRLRPGCMDLVGRFRLPRWPRRILKFFEFLLNLGALSLRFLFAPPDVLHVQFLPMLTTRLPLDLWFIRYCQALGSRIVLTVHDLLPHDSGDAHKAKFVALYAHVDALVCHSTAIRDRLVREFDVLESRISTIPHGPFFYDLPGMDDSSTLRAFDIPVAEPIVLWQGIIFPYKGVDVLLDAWKQVESRTTAGYLVIAGTGQPELLDKIRKQVGHLGLRRIRLDFRFISTEELVALYRAAAIVTYPYRAITTSGALATGLALGKTILASDLPVFRELLSDRHSAMLFTPPAPGSAASAAQDATSSRALTEALIELIGDPELREQLASRVRAMNFGDQSWISIAMQTLDTYQSVIWKKKDNSAGSFR